MPTKPKTPTPPPSARNRILKTAHDLFYREGIRATGIDRVIAEAGVTKVTFYRHFPSKNDLVKAYLEYRHEQWMVWFTRALKCHAADVGSGVQAVVDAMQEWFHREDFRGCAFINTVTELGGTVPDTILMSRDHKRAMIEAIKDIMTPTPGREIDASAIAMAIDGAIVRAQYEGPDDALTSLRRLLQPFL